MDVARPAPGLIEIELASEDETARLGRAIAELVEPGTVIGLVGPLGAGKTRLVRAIAEALGVDPVAISSPTFVLIQEYDGRLPVYHFDTYRLPSPEAFEDLGAADYWDDGVSLVEWADRVAGLLPDGSLDDRARAGGADEPTGPDRAAHFAPGPGRSARRAARGGLSGYRRTKSREAGVRSADYRSRIERMFDLHFALRTPLSALRTPLSVLRDAPEGRGPGRFDPPIAAP